MAKKTKKVYLSYRFQPGLGDSWIVTKVTNTTEYKPGQQFTKKEVDSLCEAKGWEVVTQ